MGECSNLYIQASASSSYNFGKGKISILISVRFLPLLGTVNDVTIEVETLQVSKCKFGTCPHTACSSARRVVRSTLTKCCAGGPVEGTVAGVHKWGAEPIHAGSINVSREVTCKMSAEKGLADWMYCQVSCTRL